MKKAIFLVCLAVLMVCGCEKKEIRVEDMSLEEKVSQMLMVRCEDDMSQMLSSGIGGIVMFSKDFEDLTQNEVIKKTSSYMEDALIPPFICADEEGGAVVRISSNPNLREEAYKSPAYYFREGGMDNLINMTAEKSAMMKDLGLNMNLGPVADVSTDPDDYIYKRSLGENADTTAQYVSEAVKAAKREGIASCLKHFPGYGSNGDTHMQTSVDERPFGAFYEKDFIPFKAGIAEGAEAVLVSHNIVTCMDNEYPASLSKSVHKILRDDLGFSKIIITDDLDMDAVSKYDDVYIKAVNAGNDMLIVSDYYEAVNQIINGVNSGLIDIETIDDAVKRIIKIKTECEIIK